LLSLNCEPSPVRNDCLDELMNSGKLDGPLVITYAPLTDNVNSGAIVLAVSRGGARLMTYDQSKDRVENSIVTSIRGVKTRVPRAFVWPGLIFCLAIMSPFLIISISMIYIKFRSINIRSV